MEQNLIRHKCGYCGWLFKFDTNFVEHVCFKHFSEDSHRINVDENYVVTILGDKTKHTTDSVCRDTLDELLIGAVQSKRSLYDFSTPASERTVLKKNALWTEVSNILGGAYSAEEAKSRWKYLRDNYVKARKKVNNYIPSGSSGNTAVERLKPKFKFYALMEFLNDSLETRPTVSSQSERVASSLSHSDGDASSSRFDNISHMTLTTFPESSRPETPTHDRAQTPSMVMASATTNTHLKRMSPIGVNDADGHRTTRAAKRAKSDALEAALIEALKESPPDPTDGFLTRLGEGMRRLPYRNRAQLEIRFLTLLSEEEDQCNNDDANYPHFH